MANMVFDCHLHLSEYGEDALRRYAELNRLSYTLDELLSQMKNNGVEAGILLSPPLHGGGAVPNTHILGLCAKSGGMLWPGLTVEPDQRWVQECVELFLANRDTVRAFKIRLGYTKASPLDPVFSRIYDLAEKHEVPVMFHTGDTATADGSLRHAHPLVLDELATTRPSLKIVICHFGNPWIMDAAEVAYKNPNVYVDVSGLFTGGGSYRDRYVGWLSERISEAIYYMGGAAKVVFGSDYPVEPIGEALRFARSLRVSAEDLERILWANSKRLFGA